MVSTGMAAHHGILIKNASVIQTAENIDTVVFDKTGTLTRGEPVVTNFEVAEGEDPARVLRLASSVESRSEHPLAKAVLALAAQRHIVLENVSQFSAVEGKGLVAIAGIANVIVGKKEFLLEQKVIQDAVLRRKGEQFYQEGKTLIWVGENLHLIGLFALADTPKEHAADAVTRLKDMGKSVYMITGDNTKTAQAIGRKVGIDSNAIIAGVLPGGKVDEIRRLKSSGRRVAMVGDGINDAPALAAADIGIAIGSGTDVAIESAGIVLIKNDPRDVSAAIDISRYTMRKIRQNLFWAFFYNLNGIPIAAGILYPFTGFLLNPMIAGAAMAFSSVSVVSNPLLIGKYQAPRG
jgi:Cu+-exporting ATPase